jgi:triosephosphate isomerase (TIM)
MANDAARPLIVGNWKMNGLRADLPAVMAIDAMAGACAGVDVGLALPFTLIPRCAGMVNHAMLGAQNCHARPGGAFTGEVSGTMLADCGAAFVILGHSERRQGQHEDNAVVQGKVRAAIAAGLSVILCVGESAAERATGQAETAVRRQVLASLPADPPSGRALTIAYEPVWAIGTGVTPDAPAIGAMHGVLRETLLSLGYPAALLPRLLYGGSVNAGNAAAILRIAHVDGALVGNASLEPQSFGAILDQAAGAPTFGL